METTYDQSRTFGFLSLSGILHAGLFVFVAVFAADLIPTPPKPEITEIEILSAPAFTVAMASPAVQAQAVAAAAPAPARAHRHSRALPAKAKAQAASRKAAPPVSPLADLNADSVEVPVPVLEEAQLEAPSKIETANLQDSDIAEDLAQVDQQNETQTAAELAALKQQMDEESSALATENSKSLAALEEKNAQEAQALAQSKAQRLANEKARLAEQQAAAERARVAGEKARAEREGALRAAAQSGNQQGKNSHLGSGEGVRTLAEMKQKPGNPKPQYDSDDRLHQRQGDVAFLAYVNRDGSIGQVKPIQLSGHRTLDLKTLRAIKTWKFYPGQEGWVEIPFRWDLKGGPQEMGGGLRTKVSQN